MEYKYFHDEKKQTVYRMPMTPDVFDSTGEWSIHLQIDISRADNVMVGNHWKYPWGEPHQQTLSSKYTKEQAISFFYDRATPKCEEIDEESYKKLSAKYSSISESNH
jgi:hypothetical protein